MKDALGHGSNERGGPVATHSAAIHALPAKGSDWASSGSDATWHATMPIANYAGQVRDMLGLWDGTQEPSPLSLGENKQILDAYNQRADWRGLARDIKAQRDRKVAK